MNRRKFLSYIGCSCGSFLLPSCTNAPITERKQLKIIPEARLNAQAAAIYEKIKVKEQLLDICKTIPSLTIFLIPGGSLLLPILIKYIPSLLPSAFNENKIDSKS